MIKTIKYWVSSVFYVISFLVILGMVVFVVLNWPSLVKRVEYKIVEGGNDVMVNNRVEAAESSYMKSSLLMQEKLFPTIFTNRETVNLFRDNFGKYQDNFLVIPSLNIESPIVFMDDVSEEFLQNSLKNGVGHYPDTAMPGKQGNVFIFGHSSYYWWDNSAYNSIFANLENIKNGEDIFIYSDGSLYIYRVSNTRIISADDLSVLEQGKGYKLTLMTCTPLGTNLRRFVVEANLIN